MTEKARKLITSRELHGMLYDLELRLGECRVNSKEGETVRVSAKRALNMLQASLVATEGSKGRKRA